MPAKTEVFRAEAAPQPVLSSEQIDRRLLLDRILSNPLLPSPPTLAMKIVEQVADPNCEIEDICGVLASDPPLCGKLLKVVNSVVYSPGVPVTAIERAVVILGFNRLRALVLGMSIPSMQFRCDDKGLAKFWKSSVAGAIIARELSTRLQYPAPEDDMVAALLRDLGIILLQQAAPVDYGPIWTGEQRLWSGQRCIWEEQHIGVDHAEVSAALLRSWRLPDVLVEPIRYHHYPHRAPAVTAVLSKRTLLLDFASRLADLEEVEHTPEDLRELWRIAHDHFSLNSDAFGEFLLAVSPKVEEFATLLHLDIGNCPHFSQIVAKGCEELVRLSVEMGDGPRPEAMSLRPVQPAPKIDSSAPPSRFRNYEIVREIGRGAMGVVYEAEDVDLGRRVAVKTLSADRADVPDARQRFLREARTAAAVHHENVVTIFTVGDERGVPFLVMEYVAGRSLQDWLDDGRTFRVSEIVRIGRETALGLAAAHAMRIIHRDIKPANILLEEGAERVRITDFGLARPIDAAAITQDGNIVGTPQFMSPEQVDGMPVAPASDLFSLGSVLYTLCTNRPPFECKTIYGTMHMVATEAAPPIRDLNPDIPDWLVGFIDRLHAKAPADRLPSATAIADMLQLLWSKSKRA